MGAWGHDHFDNDTAQDLICDIRSAVEMKLRKIICAKRFSQSHYWSVIAAAALIAEQGDCCGVSFPPVTGSSYRFYDLVDPAIEKLQKIVDDESFFQDWDSLDAKTYSVLSLLQRLRYMHAEQLSRAFKSALRHKRKRIKK